MKNTKKRWTQADVKALITNVTSGTTDNVELSEMLNCTTNQVYNKRLSLGLIENNKPLQDRIEGKRKRMPWTQDEDDILFNMWQDGKSDKEIAQVLGRTIEAIHNRRNRNARLRLENEILPVTKEDKPIESRIIQQTKTEISLVWGLVKYTKG